MTTWEKSEDRMSAVFGDLAKAAKKLGVEGNGGPLVEYIESDSDDVGFRAMLPIAAPPKGKLPKSVKVGSSPAGRALRFHHDGPIDDLEEVYARIDDELTKRGLDTRAIVEEYDVDALASPEDRVVIDVWVFLK
ncbi:MAG: GyrI-like domain-containing protein [Hyphomicrobiales bacterium]|nr:GyrI-like domain-containing protein [Hyphomicrobiales bacterium]